MDFLKKRLKRLTSMGLALLLSASAFPATAFAASDSTSTLAEVTAKYIDAENGKEIAEQEIYSVTHEERQPQEIEKEEEEQIEEMSNQSKEQAEKQENETPSKPSKTEDPPRRLGHRE